MGGPSGPTALSPHPVDPCGCSVDELAGTENASPQTLNGDISPSPEVMSHLQVPPAPILPTWEMHLAHLLFSAFFVAAALSCWIMVHPNQVGPGLTLMQSQHRLPGNTGSSYFWLWMQCGIWISQLCQILMLAVLDSSGLFDSCSTMDYSPPGVSLPIGFSRQACWT